MLSQETFAHICLLYFDVKTISQNPYGITSCKASFSLKLHEKEALAQVFSCKFWKTFESTFL